MVRLLINKRDRADRGNEFLCLSCKRAAIRGGSSKQEEIWCSDSSMSSKGYAEKVTFVVTHCTEYDNKETVTDECQLTTQWKQRAWRMDMRQTLPDGKRNPNYQKLKPPGECEWD